MRAISVLSFETGTSTRWCLAAAALGRRVRKAAMGSVCIVLLPAGFHDAGDFALQRHTAKTDSAHLELANIPARAAAAAAAVAYSHLEFRLLERLGDFCCTCHLLCGPFFAKWKTQPLEQFAALLVVLRAGGHGGVHALDLLHPGRGLHVLPAKTIHQPWHRFAPVFFLQSALHRLLLTFSFTCPMSLCNAGNCALSCRPAAACGQSACACRSSHRPPTRSKR